MTMLLTGLATTFAQDAEKKEDPEAAYIRVTNQRADKIVATLGLEDTVQARQVRNIIARQYRDLNNIQEERDTQIETIKKRASGVDEAAVEARIKLAEEKAAKQIDGLHHAYVSKLSAALTPQQVEQVKDGMTYGVLPITYQAYQDMIPTLTEAQKARIKAYLTEAREHAMDAGSSEKKHWWFGQYKGKINNYLSAEGYDLKKEEEDWAERREAASGHHSN